MYHFYCECGKRVSVNLSQAGMEISCPQCHAMLNVPRSSDLKRLAGDDDPHLDAPQKIAKALKNHDTPFDGVCHQCHDRPACIELPVKFDFLIKRDLAHDGGVRVGVTGVNLEVGAGKETWRHARFPLLFCEQCHADFKRRWTRSAIATFAQRALEFAIVAPIVLFLLAIVVIMPVLGVPGLIVVIVMALRFRMRKRVAPFLLAILQTMPLVSDLISAEDEYRVRVGAPRPYARRSG